MWSFSLSISLYELRGAPIKDPDYKENCISHPFLYMKILEYMLRMRQNKLYKKTKRERETENRKTCVHAWRARVCIYDLRVSASSIFNKFLSCQALCQVERKREKKIISFCPFIFIHCYLCFTFNHE